MDPKRSFISVVMFPWLAHGHTSPFLELAKKLSTRNFKIYICSSPVNLSCIRRKINEEYSSDSIELVELHVPSLPDLPPQCHTTKNLPPHLTPTLKIALDLAKPNFSSILTSIKPDLLIYDFLQPWAPSIASSYNIPAVDFNNSSIAMTAFINHLYKHPLAPFPFPSIFFRDYDRLDVTDLPNPSQNIDKDKARIFDSLERSTDIVLTKSFREVEGKYIEYLSGLLGKKIVPVPLVQECNNEDDDDDDGGINIIEWLNKKGTYLTVFVSCGTEYFLYKDMLEEIARGLEISGVNFLWVLKFPTGANISVEEALPRWFLERVGERGKIVDGWAPQVSIFQHPSIGGFVSHCGWSSVMESMEFGVPIIAIPVQLDQPVNARLVEESGVGVEVVRENGKLDRRRVAEVINDVVFDNGGGDLRKRERKLKGTLNMKGGEDRDLVVEELVKLYMKKEQKRQES